MDLAAAFGERVGDREPDAGRAARHEYAQPSVRFQQIDCSHAWVSPE